MKVAAARKYLEYVIRVNNGEDVEEPTEFQDTPVRQLMTDSLNTAIHALKKIEAEMGNVSFVGTDKVGVDKVGV